MHAVRKQILDILKERNHATVAELAGALEMPAVSVRHHLDVLQGDNLIRVDKLDRSGSVGRPQQVYILTEEARRLFPNNFAALAGNLVRQIKQVLPQEQVECAFRSMASEIARDFSCECQEEGFESRLQRVSEFLTERGYRAHWQFEQETQSYLLQKCNCPYAGVASEHRELCQMDQSLINQLIGVDCERVQSVVAGASCCAYRIQQELLPVHRSSIALIA